MIYLFSQRLRRVLCISIFSALVLSLGAGCTSGSKNNSETIDTTSALNNSTGGDKSEAAALIGEKLMFAGAIVQADQVFDIALHIDKKNVRAQFYKSICRPGIKRYHDSCSPPCSPP